MLGYFFRGSTCTKKMVLFCAPIKKNACYKNTLLRVKRDSKVCEYDVHKQSSLYFTTKPIYAFHKIKPTFARYLIKKALPLHRARCNLVSQKTNGCSAFIQSNY